MTKKGSVVETNMSLGLDVVGLFLSSLMCLVVSGVVLMRQHALSSLPVHAKRSSDTSQGQEKAFALKVALWQLAPEEVPTGRL